MNAAKRAVRCGRWCAPALALLLMCAAGVVRAQDTEPKPERDWSLKAGAFYPTQGTMRDQSGSPMWAFGVDYDPHFAHRVLDGDVFASADFFFRDSGGKTVFVFPLLANIVWSITPPETRYRVYGGLGLGVYFINPRFLGSTIQAGARFILGADVTDNVFIQVNYDYVSGFQDNAGFGVRVDGLSAMVGVRL